MLNISHLEYYCDIVGILIVVVNMGSIHQSAFKGFKKNTHPSMHGLNLSNNLSYV